MVKKKKSVKIKRARKHSGRSASDKAKDTKIKKLIKLAKSRRIKKAKKKKSWWPF